MLSTHTTSEEEVEQISIISFFFPCFAHLAVVWCCCFCFFWSGEAGVGGDNSWDQLIGERGALPPKLAQLLSFIITRFLLRLNALRRSQKRFYAGMRSYFGLFY